MPPLEIDANFPGGNVLVDSVDGDTVRLRQDIRTTTEWWFYWYLRIRHAAGRRVRFHFTNGDVCTALGPCFSPDNLAWHWLGRDIVEAHENGIAFCHTFPPELDTAWFSVGFPYVASHLEHFLATRPAIRRGILTRSEAGRDIELLTLTSQTHRYLIPLTARQHACEAMANYVVEGFLDFHLTAAEPAADWLRTHVDIAVVPFMDKDGVEAGDQGKRRAPHDHNRDWTDAPLYASVRALIARLHEWAPRMPLAIDFHCPWIRNEEHERLMVPEAPQPWAERQRRLCGLLEQTHRGPLRYTLAGNLPFGTFWNTSTGPVYDSYICRNFPTTDFGIAFEIPYALSHGQTLTPPTARLFGADLARAASLYLQSRS